MPEPNQGHAALTPRALAAGFVEAKPFPALSKQFRLARAPVEVAAPTSEFRTARLVLRPLRESDREQFVSMLEASRAHLAQRINVHRGDEASASVFDRLLQATREGDARGSAWRRVLALSDGPVLGCVHVLDIQRGLLWQGDAGWWVGAIHCNNGVATEAVAAMVKHALLDMPGGLGLHRVTAALAPDNTASKRVALRAGFTRVSGETTRVELASGWEEQELWMAR